MRRGVSLHHEGLSTSLPTIGNNRRLRCTCGLRVERLTAQYKDFYRSYLCHIQRYALLLVQVLFKADQSLAWTRYFSAVHTLQTRFAQYEAPSQDHTPSR